MNAALSELASHKPYRSLPSIFHIAAILFSFTLLSSFSGNAFSKSAVHKCLEADGHFEFTDKKCAPDAPAPSADKTAPQMGPASTETNPEPSHALTQPETVIKHPDVNTGNTSTH